MDYSAIEKLCEESKTEFVWNARLSQYCTMKIGGECDILVKPATESAVLELLAVCRSGKIPYFILGRGSNVLFSDNGFHGVIIFLGELSEISVSGNTITAGAGAGLFSVCKTALENSLSGMECLYGIPGTVGGALFMNAGAYGGEMKDIVRSCRYIDENGEIREMSAREMDLSYRHSVFAERKCCILSVTMELVKSDFDAIKAKMDEVAKKRRDKQPLEFPSCGSTFKRPKEGFAAAFIEECGLKGYRIGGAEVSEKHSGFVINRGGATAADVLALVEHIKRTVFEQKGVELECEMLVIDVRGKKAAYYQTPKSF